MSEQSDNELVSLVLNDDQNAFQTLVERYQRRVYSICYGVLKNPDDAMDACQEVFVKVYRHLQKYNGECAFFTWVYRISRNHCIDILRKKRVVNVSFDDALKSDENTDESQLLILPSRLGVDPSEGLKRKEFREQMLLALDTLSENHRSILLLREVEGLSYEELADVLGINKGTVMSRLFHARKNFQKAILPYLENDQNLKDGSSDS